MNIQGSFDRLSVSNTQTIKISMLLSIKYILPLLSLLCVIIFCFSSCSYYKAYSGQVKQLDFSFEYPRQWKIGIIEQYPSLVYMNILDPITQETESSVLASFKAFLTLDSSPDQWAQKELATEISSYSKMRNFQLISNEIIILDGYSGYQVEYSYDHPSDDSPNRFYIPIRILMIIIPKGDVVYEIDISASQNEWGAHQSDIQHILNTFKWR